MKKGCAFRCGCVCVCVSEKFMCVIIVCFVICFCIIFIFFLSARSLYHYSIPCSLVNKYSPDPIATTNKYSHSSIFITLVSFPPYKFNTKNNYIGIKNNIKNYDFIIFIDCKSLINFVCRNLILITN